MIPILTSFTIPQIKPKNDIFDITTELDSGFGIADIVFYKLDENITNERSKNNSIRFCRSHIQTVLAIQQTKTASISYLAYKLPFSEDYIKYNILKFLLENEVVSEKKNKYSLNFKYSIGLKESIAIEAKLYDWKRGLYQAYRYKWFAEESYLAIYERHIKRPLYMIDEFKKLNVGLLSVGENGVKLWFKPYKEKPYSLEMKALTYEKILTEYFKARFSPK